MRLSVSCLSYPQCLVFTNSIRRKTSLWTVGEEANGLEGVVGISSLVVSFVAGGSWWKRMRCYCGGNLVEIQGHSHVHNTSR